MSYVDNATYCACTSQSRLSAAGHPGLNFTCVGLRFHHLHLSTSQTPVYTTPCRYPKIETFVNIGAEARPASRAKAPPTNMSVFSIHERTFQKRCHTLITCFSRRMSAFRLQNQGFAHYIVFQIRSRTFGSYQISRCQRCLMTQILSPSPVLLETIHIRVCLLQRYTLVKSRCEIESQSQLLSLCPPQINCPPLLLHTYAIS